MIFKDSTELVAIVGFQNRVNLFWKSFFDFLEIFGPKNKNPRFLAKNNKKFKSLSKF